MSLLTNNEEKKEKRSFLPIAIAAGVVLVVILILVFAGKKHQQDANPGGVAMAPPDAYAANLVISKIQMSESSNMAGDKLTYIDGHITNKGNQTVTEATLQAGFHGFDGQFALKQALPLMLIRTREPYVDTQPVSAAPLAPGSEADFRMIFDAVSPSWDGNYPEIRVIKVQGR